MTPANDNEEAGENPAIAPFNYLFGCNCGSTYFRVGWRDGYGWIVCNLCGSDVTHSVWEDCDHRSGPERAAMICAAKPEEEG